MNDPLPWMKASADHEFGADWEPHEKQNASLYIARLRRLEAEGERWTRLFNEIDALGPLHVANTYVRHRLACWWYCQDD